MIWPRGEPRGRSAAAPLGQSVCLEDWVVFFLLNQIHALFGSTIVNMAAVPDLYSRRGSTGKHWGGSTGGSTRSTSTRPAKRIGQGRAGARGQIQLVALCATLGQHGAKSLHANARPFHTMPAFGTSIFIPNGKQRLITFFPKKIATLGLTIALSVTYVRFNIATRQASQLRFSGHQGKPSDSRTEPPRWPAKGKRPARSQFFENRICTDESAQCVPVKDKRAKSIGSHRPALVTRHWGKIEPQVKQGRPQSSK